MLIEMYRRPISAEMKREIAAELQIERRQFEDSCQSDLSHVMATETLKPLQKRSA